MHTGYTWFITRPENADVHRRINEARAATFHAAARSVTDTVLGAAARLSGRIRTWRRIRATRAALIQLDDRTLEDVGVARGEIERVLDMIAEQPPEAGKTLAELQAPDASARPATAPVALRQVGRPRARRGERRQTPGRQAA